jgi:hypothetical protein
MFLNYFDVKSNNFFKNIFNIFLNKNILKNNHNQILQVLPSIAA